MCEEGKKRIEKNRAKKKGGGCLRAGIRVHRRSLDIASTNKKERDPKNQCVPTASSTITGSEETRNA